MSARWDSAMTLARELAARPGGDPTGKSQVAMLAAAAHDGDLAPILAAIDAAPDRRAQTVDWVTLVLTVGGDPARADTVRALRSP
jgi:hypothetical protein